MTITQHTTGRWFTVAGLGAVVAVTLSACVGGPPKLPEIAESAQELMNEATSYTYAILDPDGVHDQEILAGEFSGQTDRVNFQISMSSDALEAQILAVDDATSFLKLTPKDEAMQELFGSESTDGKWIAVPEAEQDDLNQFTDEFDGINEATFSLIEGLSEEELDTVEVEEIELDGESVYKYIVPATADNDSDLYTGAESVAFYFTTENSELVQVDATTGDKTATHTFSDFNEVELFEAPAEEDIAELDWTF